jgi:hypothetical protein
MGGERVLVGEMAWMTVPRCTRSQLHAKFHVLGLEVVQYSILRRIAANCGVFRRFAANCGELHHFARFAAFCGELWCFCSKLRRIALRRFAAFCGVLQ